MPSVEAAVKIAQTLGISVEYLATGSDGSNPQMSNEARTIGRLADQLNDTDRRFVLGFIRWIKTRPAKLG
jgi:transcriptional regulator with XRE-family HTH domain